jgi:hypothetical protein|tara:strand:- start:335 stop:523 length:189 start_codon:yes stop_codon:yes gene_type:complete
MKNKTLVKNMPNVKWKAIPPVKGPNPQGLIDKGIISDKVRLSELKKLGEYIANTDVEKIFKN